MNLKALQKIKYGMFIVSSIREASLNGQIANTVFQVTSEPPTVGVSIAKQNLTHEFIRESRIFTISVLARETPMEFIGRFGFKSGRTTDKFKGTGYKTGVTGAPVVLDHTIAFMEAELIASLDVSTHTIFIGTLVNAEILEDIKAMSYAYYHVIKGGLTPKTAPTYVNPGSAREVRTMKQYRCNVCGYIYDPQAGDPDGGIKPGTPFEQVPDTWVCPVCGAPKSEFAPVE